MIKAAMFDTKPYDSEAFEKQAAGKISIDYYPVRLDERTVSLAQGHETVIAFVNDTLNANVIDKLCEYGVRLIAMRCAGFNNVDVRAAYGKLHIVRVPSYSPEAVAEHTAALLLASVRRIHKAYNRTRDFNFSIAGLEGWNLHGKTAGVVGAGRIGKAFLNICRGLGMKLLAYDKYPSSEDGVEFVSLETLYRESDVISLHCPLTEENAHMVNAETIKQMKPGVFLLNTSRGGLIDAEALLQGLLDKRIGAACLDVYEEESDVFFEDRSGHILHDDVLARLLSMPNVIVTSHQAFLTTEALDALAMTTIQNIQDYFEGKPIANEICYHCEDLDQCREKRRETCF